MTQHQGERHTGRLSDLVRDVLEESPESARAYLRESWLLAANRALRDARRRANLTQAEVAERMGTTQPAIARLENDREGRTTLHRYVDYALACGELPLDIVLEAFESVRQFAIDQPSTPPTQVNYQVWVERGSAASVTNATPPEALPFADPGMPSEWLRALGHGSVHHRVSLPESRSVWPLSQRCQTAGQAAIPVYPSSALDAERCFLPTDQISLQSLAPALAG